MIIALYFIIAIGITKNSYIDGNTLKSIYILTNPLDNFSVFS